MGDLLVVPTGDDPAARRLTAAMEAEMAAGCGGGAASPAASAVLARDL